jgi:DEAD/DEAH box helicase domain-containing protein
MSMTGQIIFDLETQRLAQEVGGWKNIHRMGFAAGVTLEHETGIVKRYTEPEVPELLLELQSAERVIGFNLLRFDYEVLSPYGLKIDTQNSSKTLDIMLEVERQLGFRLPLSNLAEATLGVGKSADGLKSVEWYKAGNIDQVLDYCEQDVRLTHRLWKHGCEHGHVLYTDRRREIRQVIVHW